MNEYGFTILICSVPKSRMWAWIHIKFCLLSSSTCLRLTSLYGKASTSCDNRTQASYMTRLMTILYFLMILPLRPRTLKHKESRRKTEVLSGILEQKVLEMKK
uniref:Uncharacterized protein n=1 Tax=Vespula pensylvanica TaxID=30213 RepID=A0A834KEL6_VESPE|nr:hypothetical protein H0235_015181 [Vespula pensylvanica]